LRERVADGEVVDATMVKHHALIDITKEVGERLKLTGPTCFQYKVSGGKIYLFEINARFGGGSIMTINNGFNMVQQVMYDCRQWSAPAVYNPQWGTKMRRVFKETYFYD
jgi:carbamoylphosphate synthase large subunit